MRKITLFAAMLFVVSASAQMLTQNVSQTIMADNSVACVDFSLGVRETHFFRAFPIDAMLYSSYDISAIEFAVEQLQTELPDGLPVTVRLYETMQAFPAGFPDNYIMIAEQTVFLFNQDLTLQSVPFIASLAGGETLLVEVIIPETDGSFMQLGSNNLGQTAPGYVMAPTCTITAPINIASAGFPNMHAIINVQGEANLSADDFSARIGVYPNPTTGIVNVDGIDLANSTVEISDMTGKKVAFAGTQNTIDIGHAASGIYLITIRSGNDAFRSKIVKL